MYFLLSGRRAARVRDRHLSELLIIIYFMEAVYKIDRFVSVHITL